jgi:uncharacterized membrane protein YqiK
MRRVNLRLFFGVVVCVVAIVAGVAGLHYFQIRRSADTILVKVEKLQSEGKAREALQQLAKYWEHGTTMYIPGACLFHRSS